MATLERAKKTAAQAKAKKSGRGGSSSRSALPWVWIQGDWMPSAIRQDDIDDLVEGGLIPHGSARLLGNEIEPQPLEGECVLIATHVDRGFSLPPHPFFRSFLNFYGAQLHHFTPKFHRVPCCPLVAVREFLGLPSSLGPLQAHFYLSFSVS